MKQLIDSYLYAFFFSCAWFFPANAQSTDELADTTRVSLFEYATKMPKRTNAFNFNLQMHAGFYTDLTAGRLDEAAFRIKDIKFDINGEVTDRLFYDYRQRLNGEYENLSLENLSESIEHAYIGYRLSDRFTLTAGKQDVFLGGFEYDPDPLVIYEYSDMNEYSLSYLTGVGLAYQASPGQEIAVQITNSRTGTMEQEFGYLPEGFDAPKVPLFYTLNWNSSYFDERLNLRYSVSAAQQAQGARLYNIFTGQSIEAGPWYAYFDVMYSRGGLDPLGILTELTVGEPEEETEESSENALPVRLRHCAYLSLVAEIRHRFRPKWQFFLKGMYETASVYKTADLYEKGKYRTAWGYQAGIEFYPMADDNLHLFLLGSGRVYAFTERASILNVREEGNTARVAVGFVYKLPLY